MSSKTDDISGRDLQGRGSQGRYDLPGGTYEIIETDVSGSPAGANASTAIGRRVITTYRPAYLSEDETVLACCHHAHEVAKANGAREVMLEHLVHAMVRVPEAAQVLQDRGINVESLRRESTAVISSEIPVDHTIMIAQLRASKDFNTIMHLAAAAASRRDERTLGVRDLLDALLKFDAKSRVVRMLRRHAIEGELDEPADPLTDVKALLDRYASEQRDLRLAVNELRNAQDGQTTSAVAALEDRMRGIERALNLLSDQTGDRGGMADRIKGFHDTLLAHRNDTRAMADRLVAIERMGGVGGAGNGQLTTVIGDRFLTVQKTMENHRLDLGRIEQVIAERLRSMEARQISAAQIEALSSHVGALEAKIGEIAAAGPGTGTIKLPAGLETVGDRLQGLERQISAQRAELSAWQGAIEKDVKALEEMFDMVPQGDGTTVPAINDQQVANLQQTVDGHREDTQRLEAGLKERHGNFERMLDAKLSGLGALNGVGDRLANVERALSAQRTDQAGVRGTLDSELEQIRKAMLALGNAQQTLSGAIDEWRQNNSGDLGVISNRLGALEKSTAAATDRMVGPMVLPLPATQTNGIPAAPQIVPIGPVVQIAPSGGLLDRVDRVLAGQRGGNGN